ncbi:MAG: pseudouridine synthase [Zoogloeaceae bacterium]|nr:pseudouridine synthase [Zoogloeaceae bacterium]
MPGQTGAGAQTRRKRIASEADPGERLHKILAQAGIASRREVETWILAGRVQVNGRTAQVGQRVAHDDKVKVNGRLVTLHFTDRLPRVILYHKPEGEIVSRDDPEGRSSVFSALPRLRGERWVAVGRLDINTSGLLLFTTSGKLANQLMHPSSSLLREYAARILGDLPLEAQQRLCDGVQLEDGSACFHTLEDAGGQGANHWYRVSLHEGRNREVRRLFEAVGVKVSRLMRIRYGPFALPPRLKRGQCLELAPAEVRHLVAFLKERGGDAQTRENYAPKTQGPVFSTPKRRPAKDQRDL